jgi:uncharacterized membrane protein
MKIAAIICNIVLFVFHCFVLLTDGFPREAGYIVFTLWSFFTMILSAVLIWRMRTNSSSPGQKMRIVAIICNIIFLGFVCWALVDQYPHPKEGGLIAMVVLMFLTPILNVVVLLRNGIII